MATTKSTEPVDPVKQPDPATDPNAGLTTGLPPEDYQTEQFKSPPDPVDPAVDPVKSEPVTTGPNEPYPTGNPPQDPFYTPPKE